MIFCIQQFLQRETSEFCKKSQVIFFNEQLLQQLAIDYTMINEQRVNLQRVTSGFAASDEQQVSL